MAVYKLQEKDVPPKLHINNRVNFINKFKQLHPSIPKNSLCFFISASEISWNDEGKAFYF